MKKFFAIWINNNCCSSDRSALISIQNQITYSDDDRDDNCDDRNDSGDYSDDIEFNADDLDVYDEE